MATKQRLSITIDELLRDHLVELSEAQQRNVSRVAEDALVTGLQTLGHPVVTVDNWAASAK